MKVWALWNGGSSYALGGREDIEVFESISDARYALIDRNRIGSWAKQPFHFTNREPEAFYTPVTEGSEMLIFFTDPSDSDDLYPDRILTFGPRGGVRTDPC